MTNKTTAEARFKTAVAEGREFISKKNLAERIDALPDALLDLSRHYEPGQLSPIEAVVFGINPELHAALAEAWQWYDGAIGGAATNGYEEFRDAERARFPHIVAMHAEGVTYNRDACALFMHEAAGLPLRQCYAWIAKQEVAERRDGNYITYSDGS